MTEERLVLSDLLEKTSNGDFLRAVAEAVRQLLMERRRGDDRLRALRAQRRADDLAQRLPRAHPRHLARLTAVVHPEAAANFPPFLEARKSSEKALIAVIQEAWIGGVSTRRVDDLVQAMGLSGSASRRFPSCAKRSTSACMRSSTARSPASGHIYGSTPLI
jgi:transposase-like protein